MNNEPTASADTVPVSLVELAELSRIALRTITREAAPFGQIMASVRALCDAVDQFARALPRGPGSVANALSKKPVPAGYETFDVSVTTCIAIHESDLRAGGWIREKDAANVLSNENEALRTVLARMLELDQERPADPTYWRKWWDEALTEAKRLLGSTYPRKTKEQP